MRRDSRDRRVRRLAFLALGLLALGASRCSGNADTSSNEDGDDGTSARGGASGRGGSAGSSEAGAPEAGNGGTTGAGGSNTTGGAGGSRSGGSSGAAGDGDGGESTGTGGTSGGSAGASGAGGAGAGAGGAAAGAGAGGRAGAAGSGGMAGACPTAGGEMRRIPPGYCIDRTEVTIGAYRAWIATNPVASPATQIARCASNLNFPPNPICTEDPAYNTDTDEFPQSCVDWCDAYAFCQAMGKRLCGRIGGGELAYADFLDHTLSQWHHACTSGGVNIYSFDGNYEAFECNGEEYGSRTSWVGTLPMSPDGPGCTSTVPGYEGVVALSGNVTEWEDACAEVGSGRFRCRVRGGSYLSDSGELRCDAIDDEFGDDLHGSIGFRCCAD